MEPEESKTAQPCARGVAKRWHQAVAALWLLCSATAQAQPVLATTTYGYDEAANKASQVDALGRKTSWTFDAMDRLAARTLPDGTQETYRYDALANALSRTTFAGETFQFQYDANNNLTGQVIPTGAGTNSAIGAASVITTYTPTGNVATRQEQGATTLGGLQTFTYDANDRLIEARSPIGHISYSLDPMGNVLERSIPGAGTVRYELDAAGRLAKVIAADGKAARYSYDAAGRLVAVERELNALGGQPQSLVKSIGYDEADRPVTISEVKRLGASLTFIVGQTLTRGPGGVVSKIETHRGDGTRSTDGQVTAKVEAIQSFEYDALARLTRELRSYAGASTDTRYEYDAVGNRATKTVIKAIGTEITSYTYDVADRLVQESISLMTGGTRVVSYTWDGNGNLASKAEPGLVTLYRFDPRNRLIDIRVGATQAEAQVASAMVRYAYDAEGNRVRKWTGEERGYLVDANTVFAQVALEATPAGSVEYVRGLDLIRQVSRTGTASEDLFPLHGHLGTSLGALNVDGELVEQVDSDAFGNMGQRAGLKQTHLYAGEYWDQDSQLLYLRARWYDPRIGRFVSADPFEGRQRDPRSLNRYSYAHANPVHGRDPSGRMNLVETATVVTLMAATTAAAYHGVTSTLQAVAPETSPHRKMGVWDSIAIQYAETGASNTVSDEIDQERRRQPDTHGHHTIPVYLCGAVVQPKYANITPSEHAMIHAQIAGIALTIKAAEEYAYKTLGRIRMWEVLKIAQTDPGRGAIARALEGLYRAGWWGTGAPNTIGDAFTVSRPGYVSGTQTSLPWCSRGGNP